MITFEQKGDLHNVENFLERMKGVFFKSKLDKYAQEGVEALRAATPSKSTKTASSWGYYIERKKDFVRITWTNSNIQDGHNVAIMLQYGHATKSGSWVKGQNYIVPALEPIFEKICNEIKSEVSELGK